MLNEEFDYFRKLLFLDELWRGEFEYPSLILTFALDSSSISMMGSRIESRPLVELYSTYLQRN